MNNDTNDINQNPVASNNTQTTTPVDNVNQVANQSVPQENVVPVPSSTPNATNEQPITNNVVSQPNVTTEQNNVQQPVAQEPTSSEIPATQEPTSTVIPEPVAAATQEPASTVVPESATAATQEPTSSEIPTTQVQGTSMDVPAQVSEQKTTNNIGIESGNTEILDLSAVTSNVHDVNNINIVETATLQGASGSSIIGSIEGDSVSANNNPLPKSIDLSKPQEEKKEKTKKVKVVTKKEKIISILVTIFVIIVIGAAGFAAYYFGYLKNPSIFSVKTINLELGEALPTSVSYFVDSPLQLDDMEYTVDTSQVADDIVGTYTYYVTHKNVVKSGQVIVKDSIPPELKFKNDGKLVFMLNTKITKNDLVESCEDISNCEYKLEAEIDSSTPGDKVINVIAKDDKNNQKTYTVTAKVYDIQRTVSCESAPIPSENQTYTTINLIELNFDKNDELVLTKKYKQNTFSDFFAYFDEEDKYKNDEKYVFDRASFSYKVEDDSNEVINVTSFNDVIKYYSDKSYTCK